MLKKLLRYDMSIPQSTAAGYQRTQLVQEAANEIADAYAYLDLIASRLDLDIQSCVVRKFNAVSDREDLPQHFPDDYVGQW